MLSATEPKNETAKSESASAKRRSVVSGCVVSESSSRAADSSAAVFCMRVGARAAGRAEPEALGRCFLRSGALGRRRAWARPRRPARAMRRSARADLRGVRASADVSGGGEKRGVGASSEHEITAAGGPAARRCGATFDEIHPPATLRLASTSLLLLLWPTAASTTVRRAVVAARSRPTRWTACGSNFRQVVPGWRDVKDDAALGLALPATKVDAALAAERWTRRCARRRGETAGAARSTRACRRRCSRRSCSTRRRLRAAASATPRRPACFAFKAFANWRVAQDELAAAERPRPAPRSARRCRRARSSRRAAAEVAAASCRALGTWRACCSGCATAA